jgi:hypothetical protein
MQGVALGWYLLLSSEARRYAEMPVWGSVYSTRSAGGWVKDSGRDDLRVVRVGGKALQKWASSREPATSAATAIRSVGLQYQVFYCQVFRCSYCAGNYARTFCTRSVQISSVPSLRQGKRGGLGGKYISAGLA